MEANLLFALVRARYGARLSRADRAALRLAVDAIVAAVRELRAVPLRNTDGPLLPGPAASPRA